MFLIEKWSSRMQIKVESKFICYLFLVLLFTTDVKDSWSMYDPLHKLYIVEYINTILETLRNSVY